MSFLLRKVEPDMDIKPRIFHIDFSQEVNIATSTITYFNEYHKNHFYLNHLILDSFLFLQVEYGVDYLLFQLLILGCLTDSRGYVWRKSPFDLYLVEIIPILTQTSDTKV